jgi:hypothetical protein
LFSIIFKKEIKSSLLTDRLIDKYGTIISIINEFKSDKKKVDDSKEEKKTEKNMDNNFSVMLQNIESELFIDNILLPLQKRGIPCFSRHDSIVVHYNYAEDVYKQFKKTFDRFGFYYATKDDDYFWDIIDYEEAERCGYLEYLCNLQEYEEIRRLENDEEYQLSMQICDKSDQNINEISKDKIDIIENKIEENNSINDNKEGVNNPTEVNEEDDYDIYDDYNFCDPDYRDNSYETFGRDDMFKLSYDNVDYLINELQLTTDICEDYYYEIDTNILYELSFKDFIPEDCQNILMNEVWNQREEYYIPDHYSDLTNIILRQLISSINEYVDKYVTPFK